jgi:hypothetical protein
MGEDYLKSNNANVFSDGKIIGSLQFGGIKPMSNKEFKIGTWVEYTMEDGTEYTGFVISLGAKKARVLFVKKKYKDNSKNAIIIRTMSQLSDYSYEQLSPIDAMELTEHDVRSLIDMALDLREEELFHFWSEELNVMLENDIPVLIKN